MSPTQELLAIAFAWMLVAFGLSLLVKPWGIRVLVVLVLVAIPFWELPYGYYTFRSLCVEFEHPQVFGPVEPQESICVDTLDPVRYEGLLNAGFKRIEVTGGASPSITKGAKGIASEVPRNQIQSAYCIETPRNARGPWRIVRHDVEVVRVRDRTVAIRQSGFLWLGMAWQEASSRLLGRGGQCLRDPDQVYKILRSGRRDA